MGDRPTHQKSLARAVRSLGGEWDTRRAVTALRDAGHQVDDKRAREMMRRLRDSGLLVRVDPVRARYRAVGDV